MILSIEPYLASNCLSLFSEIDLREVLDPGDFDVMIGPNSRDVKAAVLKVE